MNKLICSIIILLLVNQKICAKSQGLLPRFVSIKSNEVNGRAGPNVRYPIKWVYIRKFEPVEVIAEFEQWRKIKDYDQEESWVHESMLVGKRFVIIKGSSNQVVYANDNTSKPVFLIEPGYRANLLKCNGSWCEIKAAERKGWIENIKLWGVYPNEFYKK